MSNIYNKKHWIIVQLNKEERKLNIKVELEKTTNNVGSKEFFIRLTDADSLSFLICLKINDENFQELKHQQGLLVDLCAFGQKLIDLFELCQSEEMSDHPKYSLKICGNGELNNGENWTLNFIETNPFKRFTILSLRFCHGDVDSFKKFSIHCLENGRMDNSNISNILQFELGESDLETNKRLFYYKLKLFKKKRIMQRRHHVLVNVFVSLKKNIRDYGRNLKESYRNNQELANQIKIMKTQIRNLEKKELLANKKIKTQKNEIERLRFTMSLEELSNSSETDILDENI